MSSSGGNEDSSPWNEKTAAAFERYPPATLHYGVLQHSDIPPVKPTANTSTRAKKLLLEVYAVYSAMPAIKRCARISSSKPSHHISHHLLCRKRRSTCTEPQSTQWRIQMLMFDVYRAYRECKKNWVCQLISFILIWTKFPDHSTRWKSGKRPNRNGVSFNCRTCR